MKPNRLTLTLLLVASGLLLNFLATPNPASAKGGWRVPLDHPVLAREFRQPSADWSAGHRGVDYLVEEGQPVFASHSGEISFVGRVVNRSVVSIRHENGLISSYEPVCSALKVNTQIHTDDPIGFVCREPDYPSHCGLQLCLHFSLRNEYGYLSPLVKIGGLSPSRLKPWDGLRCNPLSAVQC